MITIVHNSFIHKKNRSFGHVHGFKQFSVLVTSYGHILFKLFLGECDNFACALITEHGLLIKLHGSWFCIDYFIKARQCIRNEVSCVNTGIMTSYHIYLLKESCSTITSDYHFSHKTYIKYLCLCMISINISIESYHTTSKL